jgi:hypothetical protein
MKELSLVSVCLSSVIVVSDAWGPLFEPMKGGLGMLTVLRARDRDDDSDDYHTYRASLEHTYLMEYYEEDPAEILRKQLFKSNEYVLKESLFAEAEVEIECVGEDCEECLIPEEFKPMPGEETIDVMAFLGIRRAEPLKVDRRTHDFQ